MLLKKQALTGAYGGFQCCFCSTYSTSTSPTVLPIPRARPAGDRSRKRKAACQQIRSYATVKDSKSYEFRDNMNWPCHKAPKSNAPSPYDILELEKGATYSKHKFYELVKIYHPDRHGCAGPDEPIHTLTQVERLERYRLVVQAHEILSDPTKRRAYDVTGAGWGAKASGPAYAQAQWAAGNPESPYANATWEDWERWYAKSSTPNGGGPQAYEGTYFNHNAFASFVILVAVISGVLQATNAGTHASSVEEKAKAFTAQTHKFMNDRKVDNASYLTNEGSHGIPEPAVPLLGPTADERVRHFLERRDPNRYGLKETEEGHYRLHFSGKNYAPPKPARDDRNDGKRTANSSDRT